MKNRPKKKLPEIKRDELARLSFCNSKKLDEISPVDDRGRRKTFVGIGWVEEGPADGTEKARVID